MGGNALKQCVTRRYTREEYFALLQTVIPALQSRFPDQRIADITAYAGKPSFGDMDLLIESAPGVDWNMHIEQLFAPQQIVRNGDVLSFEHQQLQIDLIITPPAEFDTSLTYFSYNDLGNLMGRIAHKMGFKYGHRGLLLPMKQEDHLWEELLVSNEPAHIFEFLGYDHSVYTQGFESLDSIFKYVTSTPYFNPDIYLLQNRNAISRVRDKKRPTYNQFLQWLEEHSSELTHYQWPQTNEAGGRRERIEFIQRAEQLFPHFTAQYQESKANMEQHATFQQLFNGDIVRNLTGLNHQALGLFMKHLIHQAPIELSSPLKEWVLQHPEEVETMIATRFEHYKSANPTPSSLKF